ncbi:MAG: transporter substrate-binding domain-containing protein [Emcibacteraceae bacterium]|nr:transporter substrate-binding domain-containing protein [Emcibacteraceae bacterium]MDG1707490.1 transporter substrate-binding domain-containing protein [Emcibacteraceae bacterium]MDG1995727.1 transporter substrate-binding domain-containing protein [Emcibacteraceae bacterium]
MRITTKIFTILSIIFCLVFSGSANAANCSNATDALEDILKRGKIRIGWINSKPFQYRNERGELEGVFINAGNMLGEELLKVEVEWVEAKWDTFIAGLQSGKFDIVISNVARRPNRASSVWFTKPVVIGSQTFLVRKDANIKQLSDIDKPGNNIVVRLGSAAHITYTENDKEFFTNATIKSVAPPAIPEQDVASGRAIAMGAGSIETQQIARANPDWAEVVVLPESPRSVGAGFVMQQCQHNLLHFMNTFVDTIIETNFMAKQAELYPDFVLDAVVAPTRLIGDISK